MFKWRWCACWLGFRSQSISGRFSWVLGRRSTLGPPRSPKPARDINLHQKSALETNSYAVSLQFYFLGTCRRLPEGDLAEGGFGVLRAWSAPGTPGIPLDPSGPPRSSRCTQKSTPETNLEAISCGWFSRGGFSIWLKICSFLGLGGPAAPGTSLDRPGPPRTSICMKNQPRDPIPRPSPPLCEIPLWQPPTVRTFDQDRSRRRA